MKTYNIENEHNVTTTVVKIDNDLDTDDAMALVSFFVFMFALILLGLLIYYGSSLKLWWRQSVVFPIRRLCCEKERKRLWRLHKDAVIRADRALAGARESDPSLLEEAPSSEDPLERALDSLVGLEPLKEEIRALRRTLVVEQQRRNVLNLGGDGKKRKAARVSAPHMVFRGSPGTGKTHAARLISQLLKELGYVHGDIVEVQRADLVAGYVEIHQTSELSSSVKSKSIRLIFGRIDCSHRVLEAQPKIRRNPFNYAHIEVGLKI